VLLGCFRIGVADSRLTDPTKEDLMLYNKAVRSALVIVALSGLAACAPNGGGNAPSAPAARNADGSTLISSADVQKASIKVASVTDAEGRPVAVESSAVLGQLLAVDRANVTRETIQTVEGSLVERIVIDLRDVNGSIVKFNSDTELAALEVVTGGFPASAAAVTMNEGRIASMAVTIEDGRTLNVILAFGEPRQDVGQDAKQDIGQDVKQDVGQDVKQDVGQDVKQDHAKQDYPKQDQPKQDFPKQDQPKQDQPKQDQPKQDSPKQDQPKQDFPKQDQPKQDFPKQDQPKQDQPKQDFPKQDQPKQDQPKQDFPKQDQPKQDQPKQDQPKQDQPKQDHAKQDHVKQN
jgi:hypothetical protein